MIRGAVARSHAFKSIVYVDVFKDGRSINECGGVFLISRSVLTAGHCTYDGAMCVYAGVHRLSEVSTAAGV